MTTRAQVTQVDHEKARIKVSIPGESDESGWLDVLGSDYDMPAVGTICRVAFDGSRASGLYLGPTFTTEQVPPAEASGRYVKAMAGVVLRAEGTRLIIQGDVEVQGSLTVRGNITATGSIRAPSIEEVGG